MLRPSFVGCLLSAALLVAGPALAQPAAEDPGEAAGGGEASGEAAADGDADGGESEETGLGSDRVEAAAKAVPPRAARQHDAAAGQDVKHGEAATGAKAATEQDALGGGPVPRVTLGGYLRPGFGFRVRPDEVPADQLDYGFFGVAGLSVEAWPARMWRGRITLELSATALEAVTDVQMFDVNGDGTPDGASVVTSRLPGFSIEEATAAFVPSEVISLEAGATRIPFTLQQQSENTALMFPARAPPNEVFLSGADIGLLARGNFGAGVLRTALGVFDGDSLGLSVPNAVARGVVFAARADVNPFGDFPFGEGDPKRGPFRLGLGFGAMLRPATLFDERTGTEPRTVMDLRLSGSLRMAYRGLYAVAEYFRRQQSDDFSFRPEVADGAYGEVALFLPIGDSLGIEPIVRAGFVAEDETFDPRLVGYIDGGLSFYPAASGERPDRVKLTVQYLGERRFSEQVEAHGGAVAVQLLF